jgi:hypothetical protein
MTIGQTITLTVNIQPANATNRDVTWTSSNPAVATVSANGVVTAIAPGTAVITVRTVSGDRTAQVTVTVAGIADEVTDPWPPNDPPSLWAMDYVREANALNLVPNHLNNRFTQAITRAEFTALAVRLYEVATGREIAGRADFVDTIDENARKMAYLGVVFGVGDNRFNPDGELTREQAATILLRLITVIGFDLPEHDATFADVAEVADWAREAVGLMQATGIMGGVGNNMFAPQGSYTREQSITTRLRMVELLDEDLEY